MNNTFAGIMRIDSVVRRLISFFEMEAFVHSDTEGSSEHLFSILESRNRIANKAE